jgi:hypothetical protein
MVKRSTSGSLYFWRYTLWNIRFLTCPQTSLKQVIEVKNHNFFIEDPNFVQIITVERGKYVVSYV